jgi:phospholipase C
MRKNQAVLFVCLAWLGCDDGGKGGAADMAPPDLGPLEDRRTACEFQAGALPKDTLESIGSCANPIKHVIVLMKENRSFDHYFGQLSKNGQADAEALPSTFTNLDPTGATVTPAHAATTCIQYDPHHQWADMHAQSNGGKQDGFVKNAAAHNDPKTGAPPNTDGHFALSYYDNSDLPFYYWLGSTFALADHYFPSVLSGTWSNRAYLVAGTSNGLKDTAVDPPLDGPPLIFDKLEEAHVTWQIYSDNTFFPLEGSVTWGSRKVQDDVPTFFSMLAAGTLPSVVFVDAVINGTDEHPWADVQTGEAWTRDLLDKVVKSPIWSSTVLFWVYDEAGGFFDHVAPPTNACLASPDQAEFHELGMRVPFVAISPYAKRHFVSHKVHQHTSILRFIEMLHDVPALTARDANSDALLDMFDFCGSANTDVGTIPAAGSGGCK